jgi:hypothetical protein
LEPSRARTAGWGAAILLCPHLVLGTWLLVVPDHVAFLTSQVVVLAHTVLALGSVPVVAIWVYRHAKQTPRARAAQAFSQTRAARWVLTAGVACAAATGLLVVWGGDIISAASLHAICGVAVGVPLAWHLWLASRTRAAVGVGLLLGVAIVGSYVARRVVPHEPLDAPPPAFAYETRRTDLYEPAAWCGECHKRDYDEWKRTTHARSMALPNVRRDLGESLSSTGWDLVSIGRIVKGENPPNADHALFACDACHTPTSFYGDDPQPMLTATGVSGEGVTCSFCHTIREVKGEVEKPMAALSMLGVSNPALGVPLLPLYVSAPEGVRHYLGQGSGSAFARWIAGYLIRWRPTVHSHDYHAPVEATSRVCLACHSLGGLDSEPQTPHKTYVSWKESPFNTGDPATTTTCQDCHMVERKTGKPVTESQRMVPWGPRREPGRSHLLLGGNVQAARALEDPGYGELEHRFSLGAARVTIDKLTPDADGVGVKLTVRSDLVGHYLPSMETHARYLWVRVSAVDAGGATLAATPRSRGEIDFDGPSPLIYRCTEEPKGLGMTESIESASK